MQAMYDTILAQVSAIDWSGPAAFVAVVLGVLLIFQRWSMFLLVVVIVVLGWGAQDFIVMNLTNGERVVTLPFLIYAAGGGFLIILLLYKFFKSAL
jgi:hypothetical protein